MKLQGSRYHEILQKGADTKLTRVFGKARNNSTLHRVRLHRTRLLVYKAFRDK